MMCNFLFFLAINLKTYKISLSYNNPFIRDYVNKKTDN